MPRHLAEVALRDARALRCPIDAIIRPARGARIPHQKRGAVLDARRMGSASLKHARGAAGIEPTSCITLNCGAPYCTSISVTFRISGSSV